MKFLIGVDEAGRGPLAGPVAVGLVMVAEGFDAASEFAGVRDSKKLSEKNREKIFEMLNTRVAKGDARYSVELEGTEAIDRDGIAVVIRRALARGVAALAAWGSQTSPNSTLHIQLDGALRAPIEYSQETIIKGDDLIPLISLASIAAKVTRDRLMLELAKEYPEYQFEKHKGYGTALHYQLLREHGLSAIHRKTFIHLDSSVKKS